MKRIVPLLGLSAITLLGQSTKTVQYDCQSGEHLVVTYQVERPAAPLGEGPAVLEVTGKPRITLPRTVSASGARYSDGYTVLWNKGREVMLYSGELNPKDCVEGSQTVPPPGEKPNSLTGSWRVMEIAGKPVTAERPAFIEFAAPDRASGSLGCNRFSGTYQAEGNKLKLGALASTRMACPGPAMQLETDFSMALNATASWQVSQDQLTLSDPGGKMLVVLKRE